MKNRLLGLFIIALAITACKPDPEPGIDPYDGGTSDTTETLVKKYLVKEYYANAPEQPEIIIEWNDDFSRINHITTHQNTYFQLDFCFDYYGNDSMRVVLSKPDYSANWGLFTDYTCFFDELGRINTIDYYANSERQSTQKYNYDSSGKLVSVVDEEHNAGFRFIWDGDNVCEIYSVSSGELMNSISSFAEHIHPYFSFPYLLQSGDGYYSNFLTMPLWKNWYNYRPDIQYEYDEEGYVTSIYRIDEQGKEVVIKYYEYASIDD